MENKIINLVNYDYKFVCINVIFLSIIHNHANNFILL